MQLFWAFPKMIYLFIERIKVIDSGGGGTLHLSILIGLIQLVDSDWSVPIGCRKLCDLVWGRGCIRNINKWSNHLLSLISPIQVISFEDQHL